MASLTQLTDLMDIQLLLIFSIVSLFSIWLLCRRDDRRLPPGPPALPIIGSLPFMASKLRQLGSTYKVFLEWRKKYGDIFLIRMGSQNAVVINGYKYVNETLREKHDCINRRPNMYFLDAIFKGEGVLFSNGAKWNDMRKFAVVTMRDFGLGKRSLEERIQDEARITMELISDINGAFNPREILLKTVSNIICGICFGQRYDFSDPTYVHVLEHLDVFITSAGLHVPENFFPWIEYIPKISTMWHKYLASRVCVWRSDRICFNDDVMLRAYGFRRMIHGKMTCIWPYYSNFHFMIPLLRRCNNELISFLHQQMKYHEETFDPGNIRDFMDLHIEMKQSGNHKETLTESHVFRTMIDLFMVGTETTASTMSWLLVYMLRYPDVQSKCQQEIDEVVGSGRMVALSDKPNLPYTISVMYEVQRLANIIVFGTPRAATEDFEVGGYVVPKDSIVLLHFHTVHRDETVWEAANEFRPERWMDEDGNLKRFDAFMPFSLGPRACFGEPLAMMEMFLFFTNFLQSFTFKLPDDAAPPSLEGIQTGVILLPEKYNLIAEKRV